MINRICIGLMLMGCLAYCPVALQAQEQYRWKLPQSKHLTFTCITESRGANSGSVGTLDVYYLPERKFKDIKVIPLQWMERIAIMFGGIWEPPDRQVLLLVDPSIYLEVASVHPLNNASGTYTMNQYLVYPETELRSDKTAIVKFAIDEESYARLVTIQWGGEVTTNEGVAPRTVIRHEQVVSKQFHRRLGRMTLELTEEAFVFTPSGLLVAVYMGGNSFELGDWKALKAFLMESALPSKPPLERGMYRSYKLQKIEDLKKLE